MAAAGFLQIFGIPSLPLLHTCDRISPQLYMETAAANSRAIFAWKSRSTAG